MKSKTEEMISRRRFFQKVSQRTLPILGVMAFGQVFSSCDDNLKLIQKLEGVGNGTDNGSDNGINGGSGIESGTNSGLGGGNNNGDSGKLTPSPASGSFGGHEFVDLGLSVKWARYNIGEFSPEGNSSKYTVWPRNAGLTSDNFLSRLYSTFGVSITSGSDVDVTGSSFDIARDFWGNSWALPTIRQFQELFDNCTRHHVEYKGVKGYLFVSNKNGKSIFFAIPNCWAGTIRLRGSYTAYYDVLLSSDYGLLMSPEAYFNSSNVSCIRAVVNTGTDSGTNNGGNSGVTDCQYNCSNSCSDYCSDGCDGYCEGSCSGLCENTCYGLCDGRCLGLCQATCRDNCEFRCDVGCSGWCEHVSI